MKLWEYLGEASASEVNVPISELGDTGSGETAVGALRSKIFITRCTIRAIYYWSQE